VTYYKLKTAYENAYNVDKNKIIKMKDLSWKEKRIEFSKLKPKCINCKRAVGSLFYTTKNKGERTLVAKCGDKAPVVRVGDVILRIDPRYFRPTEVETLLGDPKKAKVKLGWVPEITVQKMCAEMVVADLDEASKLALLKRNGFKADVSSE
jgi:GDPmannose 4,6-dehydratase